jgi:CHAT domain-containing protein
LETYSQSGNGGTITFNANGNITVTEYIRAESSGSGNGGNITLTSTGGAINTSAGTLDSRANGANGNGGAIALTAVGNITTSDLLSNAGGSGGNISITSTAGAVNTLASGANPSDNLRSSTLTGSSGGAIAIDAAGNITTGNIRSFATVGTGGAVTFTSNSGAIDIGLVDPSGNINGGNTSGAISLNAQGDVTTGALFSPFSDNSLSGGIGIISNGGLINVPQITYNGGGAINLSAPNGITVSSISPVGTQVAGNISLTSNGSVVLPASINTNGGNFSLTSSGNLNFSSAVSTAGGNFSLGSTGALAVSSPITTLGGNITLSGATINTSGVSLNSSNGNGNGGAIALTAVGNINTASLNSSSTAASGNGGNITLTSNTAAITTANLNASGTTNGGDITVDASTQITTGQINSSGTTGTGGNVTLDPSGDIQVTSINAEGGTLGGTVDITTGRFFQATDTFTNRNGIVASISTAGGNRGGDITIRHGGNGVTPFNVGDADLNGTAGAITSSNSTIAPFSSFPFTETEGNIRIISVDPSPPTNPPPPSTNPPSINPVDLNPPRENRPTLPVLASPPASLETGTPLSELEQSLTTPFESYLGISGTSIVNLAQAQTTLRRIERASGSKPALIYAVCVPTSAPSPSAGDRVKSLPSLPWQESQALWQFNGSELTSTQEPALFQPNRQVDANAQLELVLVTSSGKPIRRRVEGASCQKVRAKALRLRRTVTDPQLSRDYLAPAQQLYDWLVAPLESDLQAQQINNLTFIMDSGLRSIPLAALHDDKGFIVERYSVGLMPSLSLTDTRYADVRNASVLAMGASQFTEQKPLPAVPVELSIITTQLWNGQSFLNDTFTLSNLKQARSSQPYRIIHLATHAEFQPGKPSNSYIQLWNAKLPVDQMRQLGLSNPPVELLVLSACRTALGDEEVELGFAGLAAQAGVKSVMGSLWYISDEGTLGLMTEFYEQLKQVPIKAEALRLAQLAMLKGEVRLQGGKLITSRGSFPLPPELAKLGDKDLTHPYYWSAFTMVGNPW